MSDYPLKTILSTFSNSDGNKRLIFNAGPIGGVNSVFMKLFFISFPFLEYAILFNPFVFKELGIVTSIVTYIVGLSIIMISIVLLTMKVKTKVIKKITSSWEKYFPGIDINMVLSPGITPYSDFFSFYSKRAKENLSDEELHNYLLDSFKTMKEENKELIEALKRDNKIN